MANEFKSIQMVKRKLEGTNVRLHFIAKSFQKRLDDIPAGATIGNAGQELAQKIMVILNVMDYCASALNELEKIPPYSA